MGELDPKDGATVKRYRKEVERKTLHEVETHRHSNDEEGNNRQMEK